MNLRWLVKQDGTRVLQHVVRDYDGQVFRWIDVPEFREPEKDPIMAGEENSA